MSYRMLFSCLALFLFSCHQEVSMKDFDKQKWDQDPKGCAGKRLAIAQAIMLHKKDWRNMDDDDLLYLLGKPDKSFYYERNTKAFTYFIAPGSQCSKEPAYGIEGRKLTAEINATGFVSIIRIEN
jgi:hypothetical protein